MFRRATKRHTHASNMFYPVVLALLAAAAAQAPCVGEYSLCPSTSVCVLVLDQCGQCAAGEYACPLSNTSCVANPSLLGSCPGLNGTHFDTTLPIDVRVDYIVNQLSLDEALSQMTENATAIPRLSIPACEFSLNLGILGEFPVGARW